MKTAIFAITFATLALVAYTKTPCPPEVAKYVPNVIKNFCSVPEKKVNEYTDCNKENGYRFDIAGPGCGIAATQYANVSTVNQFWTEVCKSNETMSSPETFALLCCDCAIQAGYKNDDSAKGKDTSVVDCYAKVIKPT